MTEILEGSVMEVAQGEMVEAELSRLIERRSRKGEVDPDELEPGYMESVRRYHARQQEEHRAAWASYHAEQARRIRRTLESLVARHQAEAARLMGGEPSSASLED